MRVLVTGGAGYIGSATVVDLLATGHEVTVLDDLSQGHREAVHPEAALVVADLAERRAVDRVLAAHAPDAIFHFASRTQVGESMEKPFLYLGDNVRAGLNLIESAVEHGVRRFVLSSTANLFGTAQSLPIGEGAPIHPGSPYGEAKHILERMLHWADERFGMRYAALRYFNAAGAVSPEMGEDHTPETHLIPLVLQVALGQRDEVVVHGGDYGTPDGTCVRDYVHVADLARAHVLALRALEGGSRTYNLGNGSGYSVRQVVEAARAVTGCDIEARTGPRRPGDPAVLVGSSGRIRTELGWKPAQSDLHGIIESAWAWHCSHPHGYAMARPPGPRVRVGETVRVREVAAL